VSIDDPFHRQLGNAVVTPAMTHANEVKESNDAFRTTNWGPSDRTSYNSEGRLQNNPHGTRY
jgi:hypothetical protein